MTGWKRGVGSTYGGRKNCSSTTYMPRSISVSRKYLPALSNVLSFSLSHLVGFAMRKSLSDGPAGVAARREVVENNIAVGHLLMAMLLWKHANIGRLCASAVNGRAVAIALELFLRGGEWQREPMSKVGVDEDELSLKRH